MKVFYSFSLNFAIFCCICFVFVDLAKIRNKKQQKALNDSWVCRNLTYIKTHPLDCCKYPRFIDFKDDYVESCATLCRSIPYPEFWCFRMCLINSNNIFLQKTEQITKDQAVNVRYLQFQNLIGSFVDHSVKRINKSDESFNGKMMSNLWGNVTRNSIETCKYLFPAEANGKSKVEREDQIIYFYNLVVDCIRKENFLKCPDNYWIGSNNKDCEKLRNGMNLCSSKHLDFIHMLLFEDFYDQNHTKATAVKVQGYNYTIKPTNDETTINGVTLRNVKKVLTASTQSIFFRLPATKISNTGVNTTSLSSIQASKVTNNSNIEKFSTLALTAQNSIIATTLKTSTTSNLETETKTNQNLTSNSVLNNQNSSVENSIKATTKNLQSKSNFAQQTSTLDTKTQNSVSIYTENKNENQKMTTVNILPKSTQIIENSTVNNKIATTTAVNHENKIFTTKFHTSAATTVDLNHHQSSTVPTQIHHETNENSVKTTNKYLERSTITKQLKTTETSSDNEEEKLTTRKKAFKTFDEYDKNLN